ncbi:MAG: hypothetical protein ACO1N9_03455 [Flavobacterium sp.]
MEKLGIVLALFCFNITLAQKPAPKKAASNDWDELDKNFVQLIDALVKGDKAKFLSLSMKEVDCVDCVGAMDAAPDGTMFVPAEFFFAVIGQKFDQSPVYKAMAKKGYSFSSIILKDFKPKVIPRDSPKDLKLYEVWVETYYPGEFSKTHKGTSHSFRFVKINGKFRFYGLTSIP